MMNILADSQNIINYFCVLYVILCDSYLYENHFLFHVIFIKSKRAAIAALLLLILLNENSFIFYTFTN